MNLRINPNSYKVRTDNQTGIPGVHKFVYAKRKPGVKKRFTRPDKWTVQFRTSYICISYTLDDAVMRRWEEEQKADMNKKEPKKSKAYIYLKERGLI